MKQKYKDASDKQAAQITLCKKIAEENPRIKVTAYWCHVPKGKGSFKEAMWFIYSPEQKGFEWADIKFPAYYTGDIEALLEETTDELEQLRLYKIKKQLEKQT